MRILSSPRAFPLEFAFPENLFVSLESLPIESKESEDVGNGGWVCGHRPRRGENKEAREAARGGEAKDSGAQEQVRRRRWPDRPPPVRLQHLGGDHTRLALSSHCSLDPIVHPVFNLGFCDFREIRDLYIEKKRTG